MVQTETDAAARERGETDAAKSRRFQQLALPHLDAAYNLARWLCGNPSDAEDVVQEAFMRAFRFFDTFRGDSARPWLLAIVRRTWYTEWRRRASPHEMLEFDDTMDDAAFDGWSTGGTDPQALLIRDEDTKRVHEALALLPVEYREVLILRELEEMGYREIAAVADVPIGTVMSRLARGRRKLAALLVESQGVSTGGGTAGGASKGTPGTRGGASSSGHLRSAAHAPQPPPAPHSRGGCADPREIARGAAAGASEPGGNDARAALPTAGRPPRATVTPLRVSANGQPLNIPGASAAGPARETPDGL
ncbi:RNA polymerase sigma factor [Paraburkholderia ginsengisoli]|uniref:RNA polymerase sigma factor n=1 Tax=Paraburkholderia ginsengisoli TaxID=311231 RepID=A0A7T4N3Z8_9BURK|nr:RNA polymerase sigma factor [Paraburkholderia ginsengisoli]QQC64837.1 RNA polymerase sigma factor [Paraburkholderia ginsengisoli]